jgi:hypothetical protein
MPSIRPLTAKEIEQSRARASEAFYSREQLIKDSNKLINAITRPMRNKCQ